MPGRIDFEVNLGSAGDARTKPLRRGDSLRIIVLGDFSGRSNRGLGTSADLASRRIHRLDLDNFDAVFRQLSPALNLGDAGNGTAATFESLDDFHPDRLFATLAPFQSLRSSRSRLLNAATREEEIRALLTSTAGGSASCDAGTDAKGADESAEMLQRLLGAAPAPAHTSSAPGSVDALIRRLVQPHIQADTGPSAAPYVSALDATTAELMRAVLHSPAFQALEAPWRGVRRLVDALDLGDELELHIVDVSNGELLADLVASRGNPRDSAAHRLLVDSQRRGADEQAWSLLVGHYCFAADADDISLLGHLGLIASRAGGPLLAAADPSLAGCASLGADVDTGRWGFDTPEVEQLWNDLRRSPLAPWLGLALPQVLLRLPYGNKTDRIESFQFEELTGQVAHTDYLWGNAALACAQVMAESANGDDDASLAGPHDIDDLPAHVREIDGERRLQPCAEFLLPIRVGDELLQRGLIPLLSYGNRNSVRVMPLQSIALPSAPLAGLGH